MTKCGWWPTGVNWILSGRIKAPKVTVQLVREELMDYSRPLDGCAEEDVVGKRRPQTLETGEEVEAERQIKFNVANVIL